MTFSTLAQKHISTITITMSNAKVLLCSSALVQLRLFSTLKYATLAHSKYTKYTLSKQYEIILSFQANHTGWR